MKKLLAKLKAIPTYIKLLFKGSKILPELLTNAKAVREAHQKSSWKSSEFLLTLGVAGGALAAQAGGLIPPPWGPVVLAASGALYALSRGLAKNGDPKGGLKPGLTTTELVATISAQIAVVLSAISGAVSAETAAILVAISNGAYGLSRGLAKGGKQPE